MKLLRLLSNVIWLIAAIIGIRLMIPGQPPSAAQIGLDESWKIALQVGFENKLLFGHDFLFTYGPLGFLAARLNDPDTISHIAAYDHYLIFQLVLLALTVYRVAPSLFGGLFFLTFSVIMASARYYLDPSIILFLLSTFWLFSDHRSPKLPFFVLALIDALLSLYIKVNLGLAAVLQIFCITVIQLLRPETRKKGLIRLLIVIISVPFSALFVPVSFWEYLRGAAHIANGFNDAMYIVNKNPDYLWWSLVSLATLAVAIVLSLVRRNNFLLPLSCAGFAFLLFKQSFVRADEHIYVFFDYIAAPFALLALFSKGWERKIQSVFLAAVCITSLSMNPPAWQLWDNTSKRITNYYEALSNTSQPSPHDPPLSAGFTSRIGRESVDFMPDNASLLYHSGLNYIPRPVIQSYSAYDSYLDTMNAEFLKTRGQQFVFFTNGCVDDRYCVYDETETKIALLENYSLDYQEGSLFLMKRRDSPQPFQRKVVKKGRMRLGERLYLGNTGTIKLVTFKIDYSIRGKLQRLLYQPPELRVTVKTSARKTSYRAIVPILKGGIIANLDTSEQSSIQKFLSRDLAAVSGVEFIRLHSNQSKKFTPYFDYEITELTQSP